jgi:carbonic anhydrase
MKKIIITLFILFICSSSHAQDVVYPKTKEFQQSLTPDMVIEMLKSGNNRFMTNMQLDREYHTDVETTAQGQYPWAIVHGCMDSRVPVEMSFDLGIGDIFSTRVAGNIINVDFLGSIEYACQVVGSKLVLVLGHTECGAVKGAIDDVQLGNVTTVLEKIAPSVERLRNENKFEDFTSKNKILVDDVTVLNVRAGMDQIRSSSQILRDLEASGSIKIVGAVYDVFTGKITFLDN